MTELGAGAGIAADAAGRTATFVAAATPGCARVLLALLRWAPPHAAAEGTPQGPAESRPSSPSLPMLELPRVLIVDDSALNAALLREGLEREGIEVTALSEEREGMLQRIEALRPSVLLLDWFIPGLDTAELCRAIRGSPLLTDTRVLLLTGLPESEASERARAVGAVAALTKDLGIPTIVERVRALTSPKEST